MDEILKDILWCISVFFLAFLPAYIFEQRIKYQTSAPVIPGVTVVPEAHRVSALSSDQLLQNCVICFSPTNSRCSGCKEVNYCSSKCQVIHWKQGHNKKCQTWNLSGVAAAGLTPQQMTCLHGSKYVAFDETSTEKPSTQTNEIFNIEKGRISRSQEAKFRNEYSTNIDSLFSPVSKESVCVLQNEQEHKAVRSILDEWNQPIKNLVKATEMAKYAFEHATKVKFKTHMACHDNPSPSLPVKEAEKEVPADSEDFKLGNDAFKEVSQGNVKAKMACHDKPTPSVSLKEAKVEVPALRDKGCFHICTTCFAPASTRCAQCKSVYYCSSKCQIIHWRWGHKKECQPLSPSTISANRPESPNKPQNSLAQSVCELQNLKEQKAVRSIPEEWDQQISNLVKATEMAFEQGSKVKVKAHMDYHDKLTPALPVKVAKVKVPEKS